MLRGKIVLAAIPIALLLGCGTSGHPTVIHIHTFIPASDSASATVAPAPAASPLRPRPAPTPDPAANVAAYLKDISSLDPTINGQSAQFALPGSPAWLYSQFHADVATAALDNNVDQTGVSTSITKTNADDWNLCDIQNGQSTCFRFNQFVTSASGKLLSFDLNGTSISQRLAKSGGTASSGGVTMTITSSYETSNLLMTVDLANAGTASVNIYDSEASYQGSDGVNHQATIYYGPTTLRPGEKAHYEFVFPAAKAPGTVYATGSDAGGQPLSLSAPIG